MVINIDAELCLKHNRAPKYHVRYVMIVLVERGAFIAQINDLHFLKQRIFTNALTGVTIACEIVPV